MSLKYILLLFGTFCVLLFGSFFVYHRYYASSKIAYVRTGEVIAGFNGFKKAQKQFESELLVAQSNSDTLSRRLRNLKEDIAAKKKSIQAWSYQIGVAENELMQYQKNADAQMQARQQELSKGEIDKINLFIQEYGKKNSYKLILGSTDNGSILYGRPEEDITKEVLSGLNSKYPLDSLKR